MTKPLPQLCDQPFLTDAGMETDLIFNEGIELPHFASITLVGDPEGERALVRYYQRFLSLAAEANVGFILESPTWRASPDWGPLLGYDDAALRQVNERAIELLKELRATHARPGRPTILSGCVGPRGDGYVAGERMAPDEARAYHDMQIGCFARAGADMVTAMTITCPEEAIGIVLAARDHDLPVAISFTVETDGRLPSGETLAEAIDVVDTVTADGPAYYMINCAHPDHFAGSLSKGARWTGRIRGIRANASRMSHAELDNASSLDAGDPQELAALYADLRGQFAHLTVLGGCCGTDHRHLEAVRRTCF